MDTICRPYLYELDISAEFQYTLTCSRTVQCDLFCAMFCFIEHDCRCMCVYMSVLDVSRSHTTELSLWLSCSDVKWNICWWYIYIYLLWSTLQLHLFIAQQVYASWFFVSPHLEYHESQITNFSSIKTFKLWFIPNFE